MSRQKVVAIDFDGTICKWQPFKDGVIWQEPNEGAAEILTKIKAQGWKIIIHTCRVRKSFDDFQQSKIEVGKWLAKHGIPFDEITDEKPIATFYIDDRALRFTNWQDMKNYLV